MSSVDYGKIITIQSLQAGIITDTKHEYEQSIFSTKDKFIREVIECMGVITDGTTNKVTLEIKVDDKERVKVLKRWQA